MSMIGIGDVMPIILNTFMERMFLEFKLSFIIVTSCMVSQYIILYKICAKACSVLSLHGNGCFNGVVMAMKTLYSNCGFYVHSLCRR